MKGKDSGVKGKEGNEGSL